MAKHNVYSLGLGTGIGATTVVLLIYQAILPAQQLSDLFAALPQVDLPYLTTLVLHPAWVFGVPTIVAATLVWSHFKRSAVVAIGAGVVGGAAAMLAQLGYQLPFTLLSSGL